MMIESHYMAYFMPERGKSQISFATHIAVSRERNYTLNVLGLRVRLITAKHSFRR